MASGTIVASWQNATHGMIAVRVSELEGSVEYLGAVALVDLAGKSPAQKKALLIAAARSARDAQLAPTNQDLGITGTATL